eukprot:4647528-Pleurochrysis_carterae.AAC.1
MQPRHLLMHSYVNSYCSNASLSLCKFSALAVRGLDRGPYVTGWLGTDAISLQNVPSTPSRDCAVRHVAAVCIRRTYYRHRREHAQQAGEKLGGWGSA